MRARLVLLLALVACGCGKGSALVRVEVDGPGLVLDSVELSLTSQKEAGGTTHNRQVILWPVKETLSVGLYVPESVSGVVWAHARGLRGSVPVAEAEPQSVSVSPGNASGPVHLRLVAGAMSGVDGGVPDGGLPAGDGGVPGDAAVGDTGAPLDVAAGDAAADQAAPTDGGSPSAWLPPRQVEVDPIDRDDEPVVAVDPVTGDAVVLYVEKGTQLEAVRYTRATDQWSEPQVLATGGQLGNVKVGLDATGHAFALWTLASAGVVTSQSSDRGATWSKPAAIRPTTTATATSLAVGRNNRARAAWEEHVGNYDVMFSAYFDGTAWSAAQMPLASNDFFGTRQASIAVDKDGAGWIAWAQPEPDSPKASEHLYVSRFTGPALQAPQILDTEGASVQPPPVLAMTSGGTAAVVVWQQNYADSTRSYLASVWSPAAGWSAPEKAVPAAGERPDVTIDPTVNVTLAYQAILPASTTRNTLVVRREAGKWTTPKTLETTNTAPGGQAREGEEPSPVARADAQGNVWVVWRKGKNATTYGLSAARFVAGQGWLPEVSLASRQDLAASWPLSMGMTDDGRALLVWVYVRGSASAMDADLYNLYAAFSR